MDEFPPSNQLATSAKFSRRKLLTGVASGLGAVAIGSTGLLRSEDGESALSPYAAEQASLVTPQNSGIEHIVLVMMENRSFDHFLGWLPGSNGRQQGLLYRDATGSGHATHHLSDYQGCGHPDPDHSYKGGRVEYDEGECDGWLRAGSNDDFSVGYYTEKDLAFLGQAAPDWTVCDRYFAAIMAETYPNRIYQHAGQTDRLTNTTDISVLPTIWDRLSAAGVSGNYYYSDVPILALWGAKYLPISRPIAGFLTDCAAGTLPQVSYVDPRFLDESSGTSGDDHPHADIRNGEVFLNTIYSAVTQSPNWRNTVLVINFDEWGGFFEHVPPPAAPIPPADQMAGNLDGLRGFRVPCLLISPWARRHHISNALFDHTSVLRMIEWRWKLAPLTVRDATARNIASALALNPKHGQDLTAPQYYVAPGPFGSPCSVAPAAIGASAPLPVTEFAALKAMAKNYGWPISG